MPVYLAEVSPLERRGSLVTRNEVMIVSGQFAAFIINAIIFNVWGEHDGVWRYMLLVAVLPAFALFFGMLRMPESPRWLTSQDRNDEALEVLKQVRSDERAEAEMAEVHRLAVEEKEAQTGGWADLAVPWIRRLLIVGIGLGVFQQFTGINSIMYYGSQLLEDAGFSAEAAIIANTANGLFSVLGITVGILLMNRIDRRVMLLAGFSLTTLFHILVGLSALLLPDSSVKPYIILLFVVLFVFCMQATIGPLVWLLLAEIFPLKIRSFAMGVCVFMLWMANASSPSASRPWWTRSASHRRSSSSPDWGCWRWSSSTRWSPRPATSPWRTSKRTSAPSTADRQPQDLTASERLPCQSSSPFRTAPRGSPHSRPVPPRPSCWTPTSSSSTSRSRRWTPRRCRQHSRSRSSSARARPIATLRKRCSTRSRTTTSADW